VELLEFTWAVRTTTLCPRTLSHVADGISSFCLPPSGRVCRTCHPGGTPGHHHEPVRGWRVASALDSSPHCLRMIALETHQLLVNTPLPLSQMGTLHDQIELKFATVGAFHAASIGGHAIWPNRYLSKSSVLNPTPEIHADKSFVLKELEDARRRGVGRSTLACNLLFAGVRGTSGPSNPPIDGSGKGG
jgi:hypothetical protein